MIICWFGEDCRQSFVQPILIKMVTPKPEAPKTYITQHFWCQNVLVSSYIVLQNFQGIVLSDSGVQLYSTVIRKGPLDLYFTVTGFTTINTFFAYINYDKSSFARTIAWCSLESSDYWIQFWSISVAVYSVTKPRRQLLSTYVTCRRKW